MDSLGSSILYLPPVSVFFFLLQILGVARPFPSVLSVYGVFLPTVFHTVASLSVVFQAVVSPCWLKYSKYIFMGLKPRKVFHIKRKEGKKKKLICLIIILKAT